jgi:hypothetical protein
MAMKTGLVGNAAAALLGETAINDLAIERREHASTRAELARARAAHDEAQARFKVAVIGGPLIGACFGALAILAYLS